MWKKIEDKKLYRKFSFTNFSEAFAFMTRVAMLSEGHNHHPTWTNTYNVVEIWLTTHDNGGNLSDKDRKLADAIDKLLS